MARVTVDFSEVEEFALIDEGDYLAEIEKVEYREPQSEDKYPYLNVTCIIREEGEFEGQRCWGIWSFSPKALWRAKAAWENLGIIAEDAEIELDVDEDTNLVTEPGFAGLPCIITVKHEPYEGNLRARVEAYQAAESTPKPKDRGRAKAADTKKDTAKKAGAGKRKFA